MAALGQRHQLLRVSLGALQFQQRQQTVTTQFQQAQPLRLAADVGQQVAVGGGEAPVAAIDVGIEKAQPPAAGHQRGDDAAALLVFGGTLGAMAQAGLAAAAGFVQPGRDGLQQRLALAALRRQAAAGDARPLGGVQHQHHALGAAEPGHLGDQALADRHLAIEFAQANAGAQRPAVDLGAARLALAPVAAAALASGRVGETLSSAHQPLPCLPGRPCGAIIRHARRLECAGCRCSAPVNARSP